MASAFCDKASACPLIASSWARWERCYGEFRRSFERVKISGESHLFWRRNLVSTLRVMRFERVSISFEIEMSPHAIGVTERRYDAPQRP